MTYNIGIIDDDSTKVTQLLTYLMLGWEDESGNVPKEKYKEVVLNPIELPLKKDINEMVKNVRKNKIDALVIDYKLSSQQNISYSGVSLAKAIDKTLHHFPIFLLTSFQDDLYDKECFDVYQVFDFERFITETKERIDINSKIVEQIRNYKKTLLKWKEELNDLLPKAGQSADIDSRIMELDSWIEKSIDGKSALSDKFKHDLSSNHIKALIDRIDKIIKEG